MSVQDLRGDLIGSLSQKIFFFNLFKGSLSGGAVPFRQGVREFTTAIGENWKNVEVEPDAVRYYSLLFVMLRKIFRF